MATDTTLTPDCPKCTAPAKQVQPIGNKTGWWFCTVCAKTFQV